MSCSKIERLGLWITSEVPDLDGPCGIDQIIDMEDHDLKQTDLVECARVGKSTISEILNYKKRMSQRQGI